MFEPDIKQTEPMTVAYLAMRGPYAQIPEAMGTLYGRVQGEGMTPAGMPMGVYLTNPQQVPEEQAVWELWAPVAGQPLARAADGGGFGVRSVEPETVAFAIHKGPYDTVDQTYAQLMGWLASQGREVIGPPREAYLSDPGETAPEEYLTEIQLPIR